MKEMKRILAIFCAVSLISGMMVSSAGVVFAEESDEGGDYVLEGLQDEEDGQEIIQTGEISKTAYFVGESFSLSGSGFSASYDDTVIVNNGMAVWDFVTTPAGTLLAEIDAPFYQFTEDDIESGKDYTFTVTANKDGTSKIFTQHFDVLPKPSVKIETPDEPVRTGDPEHPGTAEITVAVKAHETQDVYGFRLKLNFATQQAPVLSSCRYEIAGITYENADIADNAVILDGDGTEPVLGRGETAVFHMTYTIPDIAPSKMNLMINSMESPFVIKQGIQLSKLLSDSSAMNDAANKGDVCRCVSAEEMKTVETTVDGVNHPLIDGYYQLSTPDDILWLADKVNSGNADEGINAYLMNDIDMTGTEFSGIGTEEHPFIGTFNGYNYATCKVTYDITGGSNTGFFGVLGKAGKQATVGYISVYGSIRADGDNVGGIAGKADIGSMINRCESHVEISSEGDNVGGVVGYLASGFFLNNNYASVSGRNCVGGIVGKAECINAEFSYCVNEGNVEGSGDNVGGIVGLLKEATNFFAHENKGDVTGSCNVGGIAGSSCSSCNNEYSFAGKNTGKITGKNNTGGFVGLSEGDTFYSNATGAPTNSGNVLSKASDENENVSAGGVIGTAKNTNLINVSNTGLVSGSASCVGGIIGYAAGESNKIANSWNTGKVESDAGFGSIGGIIGRNEAPILEFFSNVSLGDIEAGESFEHDAFIGTLGVADSQMFYDNYHAEENGSTIIENAESSPRARFMYSSNTNNYVISDLVFEGEGDGTEENPYQLSSVNDIIWFAKRVNENGGATSWNTDCAVLMADIDMSGIPEEDFSGIGKNDLDLHRYGGIFDGNGHTITINMSGEYTTAFFGYTSGATIKNLTIDGELNGSVAAGIAAVINDTVIEDCCNNANIKASSTAGGIASSVINSKIINCSNSGTIEGGEIGSSTGGIAGSTMRLCKIENCKNTGAVSGGGMVGGIVGVAGSLDAPEAGMASRTEIIGCSNTADVTSTNSLTLGSFGSYDNSIGGIAGVALDGPVVIDDCNNSGTVSGANNNLGGILGYASPSPGAIGSVELTITDCVNSGKVMSKYNGSDTIKDPIFGIEFPVEDRITVGGIVGSIDQAYTAGISGNKNTGEIDGGVSANVSSIVGVIGIGQKDVTGNSSTVLVGNDKDNPDISLIEKEESSGNSGNTVPKPEQQPSESTEPTEPEEQPTGPEVKPADPEIRPSEPEDTPAEPQTQTQTGTSEPQPERQNTVQNLSERRVSVPVSAQDIRLEFETQSEDTDSLMTQEEEATEQKADRIEEPELADAEQIDVSRDTSSVSRGVILFAIVIVLALLALTGSWVYRKRRKN